MLKIQHSMSLGEIEFAVAERIALAEAVQQPFLFGMLSCLPWFFLWAAKTGLVVHSARVQQTEGSTRREQSRRRQDGLQTQHTSI